MGTTVASAPLFAADGTVNFTGTIIENACKVDTASNKQTVNLGQIPASAFTAAGSTAAGKAFSIKLTNCPAGNAAVRFDGALAKGNSAILSLNSDATATNVGVGIYEQDSATMIPMGTSSASVTLNPAAENVFNYIAKYYAVAHPVTAGSANATTAFTIIYN